MRFILSFTRDSIKSMIQFDNGIKIDAFLNAFKVRKKKGKANCDNSKWDGILALNRIGQVTRARDIMEVRIKEAQNRLIEVPTVISLVSDARYRPPRFHEYPPLENTMVTERWLVKSGPGEGWGAFIKSATNNVPSVSFPPKRSRWQTLWNNNESTSSSYKPRGTITFVREIARIKRACFVNEKRFREW